MPHQATILLCLAWCMLCMLCTTAECRGCDGPVLPSEMYSKKAYTSSISLATCARPQPLTKLTDWVCTYPAPTARAVQVVPGTASGGGGWVTSCGQVTHTVCSEGNVTTHADGASELSSSSALPTAWQQWLPDVQGRWRMGCELGGRGLACTTTPSRSSYSPAAMIAAAASLRRLRAALRSGTQGRYLCK